MRGYQRTALPELVFRDSSGAVIPFGSRWGPGSPPEETYSVVSHPERFDSLHDVARALISHVQDTFDVIRHDGELGELGNDSRLAGDVLEAVTVTPSSPASTALTFAFTRYPGVIIAAGLLHAFTFPSCGCDACDEELRAVAERMEQVVDAVTAGRFVEVVARWPGRQVSQRTWGDGWSEAGETPAWPTIPRSRRAAIGRRLRLLPGNAWQAWASRSDQETENDTR